MGSGGRLIHAGTGRSLAEGVCRRVRSGGSDLVVVRAGRRYHAFDNNCPHQHFASLHEGGLQGTTITCPMHGWSFDVRTGRSPTGEGRLELHTVETRGDEIWISIDE